MLTAMVAGYYEPNGNEVYAGTEGYGEYCYGIQDMCAHMPCTFHGPPGLRMVQNGGTGPVPMHVQIPPGHVVQQIVDENGAIRHVLVAGPMMPVGANYNPSHASSAMGTQYYSYPPYGHPYPPSHMQPMSPLMPHPTATSPCNGEAPQDASSSPNQVFLVQKEENYHRSTYKFRRKLDGHMKDKLANLSNESDLITNRKERKMYLYDDAYRMSGSSASGSNASEDEVPYAFTEYLSSLRPPMVAEVSPYSVMVCWKPPDVNMSDLDPAVCASIEQSEITYEVMLCEKSKENRYKSVYSGTDHHCNITALKPATEYYVCVQASMDDMRGNSVKGLSFKTPPAEPGIPQPPRLCGRTKNSLTLKWNSNNESSSSKVNFILEYDEGYNGSNFSLLYTGPLKQYKVTKLSPGTGYRFRLAAMNDKGKSMYSETCCYFTNGNTPSQPSPPVLKQAYINRLHVEWERRIFDDSFTLQIEDEGVRHSFLTAYNGRESNFICSGLRGNTEYKFRVCAINDEGTSPWSKSVVFCTLPDVLNCPSKPNAKGRIHASCFRIIWDPPKDCQLSSITKYILEVDKGLGFEPVYTGPETEFFLENLLPGTTYKLRVTCISPAGHSPYSDVNSITTAAVSPGKCALPKLQSKPEASFVCLDWAHPEHDGGSAVAEYEVDMTSPDNVTLQVYRGPETSCIVSGLLPGRPYLFQVRAYNRIGAGPFSDPLEVVSGAGPPDSPRNLMASFTSHSCCVLTWEEPVNNGAAITAYILQWSTEEDDESFRELYEGLSLFYEVRGLLPATSYFFKVRAINEAGQSSSSEIAVYRTPISVPNAISNIQVKPTSKALHILWPEPVHNGSEVMSYNVELDGVLYNTEGSAPELCIEDLSPETSYRIRVQAINSVGEGPFSEFVTADTLKSPPSPPTLHCSSSSHNFLRLKWGDASKANSSAHFTVEMCSKSKSFVPVYHGTGFGCKISRLQENSTLSFRICASNESGQGPFSQLYTFRTSWMAPPSLKAPKVSNITESSCLVEWIGIKQQSGATSSYVLQMLTGLSSDSVTVYEGSETRCTIENLQPSTNYYLKVAVLRHCEGENLLGSYSPLSSFATCGIDIAPLPIVPQRTPKHNERRVSNDKLLATFLVFIFNVFSFLVAMLLEHYIIVI